MNSRSVTEAQKTSDERAPGNSYALAHYLTGGVLVRLADEGARVMLVLLALERVHSAAIGGALVAALLIPHVIAAPAVGLLIDRAAQPRRVLAIAGLGFAVTLAAVGWGLGRLPLGVVIAMLLIGGCCGPALTGGLISQLGTFIPARKLPRAFSLDSLSYNVAGIIGPTLAATVAALGNATTSAYVLAGSAVVGSVVLATLPIPRRQGQGHDQRFDLTGGFAAVFGHRILRAVTVTSSLGQLGSGALPVIAGLIAIEKGDAAASGWLLTAVAAGALIGSVVCTWKPVSPRRAPRVVMASLVGSGLPLMISAMQPGLAVMIALFAVSGVFVGPFAAALFVTRQTQAPPEVRAQVFTLGAGLKTTTVAAGAALGGLAAGLPVSLLLLLAGASPVVAGAIGGLTLRSTGDQRQ